RHVARAYSHHLEHAVAWLHTEHVAALPAYSLGLADDFRLSRVLHLPFSHFRSPGSDSVHARGARSCGRGDRIVSKMLLAEFAHAYRLREAAETASRRGYKLLDALPPFPVQGVAGMAECRPMRVRVFMFAGGIVIAAMALGGEYYTAVFNYPYNAGGRPLNSWPAFMLVPFATGILGATIAGFIRFLFETGLPRL